MKDLSHHRYQCRDCGADLDAVARHYVGLCGDCYYAAEGTDGSGEAAAWCFLGAIFITLMLVIWWVLA